MNHKTRCINVKYWQILDVGLPFCITYFKIDMTQGRIISAITSKSINMKKQNKFPNLTEICDLPFQY